MLIGQGHDYVGHDQVRQEDMEHMLIEKGMSAENAKEKANFLLTSFDQDKDGALGHENLNVY